MARLTPKQREALTVLKPEPRGWHCLNNVDGRVTLTLVRRGYAEKMRDMGTSWYRITDRGVDALRTGAKP